MTGSAGIGVDGTTDGPEQLRPFLRGAAFRPASGVPYPRARDDTRLPRDTWAQACLPAGVRLEFVGDAESVTIGYRTETDDPGFRGTGGGSSFQLWCHDQLVTEERAVVGEGSISLDLGERPSDAVVTVYLPEIMLPTVLSITAREGSLEPAPRQPQWVAYGDSILEGWTASAPALAWGARVQRRGALDLVNMGYAGAARGELVSAEHVASRDAAIYSLTHGTNCWSGVPHSAAMMRANLTAFLDLLLERRPHTPVVVAGPVVRPEAEDTPNVLGASLTDLRAAMEDVVAERIAGGDERLALVKGAEMIDETMLADGIHPDDAGHAAIAAAIGPTLVEALDGAT